MNKLSITLVAGLLVVAVVLNTGCLYVAEQHIYTDVPVSTYFDKHTTIANKPVGVDLDKAYVMEVARDGLPDALTRKENVCQDEVKTLEQCKKCCRELVGYSFEGKVVSRGAVRRFIPPLGSALQGYRRKCVCFDKSNAYEVRKYTDPYENERADEESSEKSDEETDEKTDE